MEKSWKVPLDKKGCLLSYDNYETESYVDSDITWTLQLKFTHTIRGRSSVTILGRDSRREGHWPIKINEFMKLLNSTDLEKGQMKTPARFGVVKLGRNFSLSYLGDR